MTDPSCSCFEKNRADMENRVYGVGWGVTSSVEVSCMMYNICEEAYDYVAMTVIVMLVRSMAVRRAGGDATILTCDKQFDEILDTLRSDVTARDEIINALLEARQQERRQ